MVSFFGSCTITTGNYLEQTILVVLASSQVQRAPKSGFVSQQGKVCSKSEAYLLQLIWTFAFSHEVPQSNVQKMSGCSANRKTVEITLPSGVGKDQLNEGTLCAQIRVYEVLSLLIHVLMIPEFLLLNQDL